MQTPRWFSLDTPSTTLEGLNFPADFSQSHPFIHEMMSEFSGAVSDEEKLNIISKFQRLMNLIRYDNDHIYDQDDTALLPEWSWLYDVVNKIESTRKELFANVFGDLAE